MSTKTKLLSGSFYAECRVWLITAVTGVFGELEISDKFSIEFAGVEIIFKDFHARMLINEISTWQYSQCGHTVTRRLIEARSISFPEPTCLLVSTKTRSSGIINKLVPRALVSFAFKI